MKYIYILTALIFMGCSEKTASVEKRVQKVIEPKVEIVQVANVVETKKEVASKKEVLRNETVIEEPKVLKNIASDVPSSCAMWSDGSNICNRVSRGKASCTTNPVENRMFSCLQWQ